MTRLSLLGAAVTATVFAMPTANVSAAVADGPRPSLVAKTYIGGRVSPATTVVAPGWIWRDGAWTVEIRSASLPSGRTKVVSTWTSPTVVTHPNVPFFAVRIDDTHQGTSATNSKYVDQARVCVPNHGCGKWWIERADELPQDFTEAVPYRVSVGHGISFGSRSIRRVYVQWRFVQVQQETDEQTTGLTVAVGAGAAAVARELTV